MVGLYNFNSDTHRTDTLKLTIGRPGTEIYTQNAQLKSYAAYGDVTVPMGERFAVIGEPALLQGQEGLPRG
ncbi:hypothetical protein ACRAWD_30515 [Caulobacter segnis]